VSNVPSKAGFKIFSEPPWIVATVFTVSSHLFAAVLEGIFDLPSTKIVEDLVCELISVDLVVVTAKKNTVFPSFLYWTEKNHLIVKTILPT